MPLSVTNTNIITGLKTLPGTAVTVSGSTIDLSLGDHFTKTVSGDTTFSVTNIPTDSRNVTFIVELVSGSSAVVNWWSSIKWKNGVAPRLSQRDIIKFSLVDGTWYGVHFGQSLKSVENSHWINIFGTPYDYNYGIAVDSFGNVYTSGYTNSQVGSNYKFLIVKYNTAGVLQWQRTLGSTGESGYDIAVDSSGNVYVSGETSTQGAGGYDALIAKYDTNGTLQWQRTLGGADYEGGYGIAVDSSGNVYVTGSTFSQGAGSADDIIIAKYNTSGTLQWQRTLGGADVGQLHSVAVDSSGNVYITGETYSQGAGNGDILIAKYNTSGTLQWQRTLGGASFDYGQGVTVDSSGNVYVTGSTFSQGAGNGDVLIAKYNTNGTLQWQRTLGGADSDVGYRIAVDSSGNVYITGYTSSQGAGSNDVIIAKYDTSGVLQWQRTLGGAGGDYAEDIAVDSFGNVYITGYGGAQGNFGCIVAKLPGDGSGTGAYFNNTLYYLESTLTSATSTLTDQASTLTDQASTLTDQASTLTSAASNFLSAQVIV